MFIEHRFCTHEHTDFHPQHLGHPKARSIAGIPFTFKPSRLVRKILFSVERTGDSVLQHECLIRQPFAIPHGPGGNNGGKIEINQPFKPLFMCAEAEMSLNLRKDSGVS